MELVTIILFALALNMDALGTGIAYGMRKIILPFSSLLIISLTSVAAIVISMQAGNLLTQIFSPGLAHRLGGAILLCIGIWILVQAIREAPNNKPKPLERVGQITKKVMQIRIRSMGLVIQVLREPTKADFDSSGVITAQEALILGLALSMDAFGAGFAVSMLGFSLILTALVVGIGHIILTYVGLYLGKSVTNTRFGRHFSTLPGCILILLGLFKLV
ncbi:sporulation membrane protein YtaF [Desulfolucanica intricata]|uniref:sporulation membrane protein YtaF n=1 Tax=Desulfolucanica intricata TaxID=1285191 RepID=UPI00082F323B|nr:sporulation membrane protein YtaF [Desulfolucanica intricata]